MEGGFIQMQNGIGLIFRKSIQQQCGGQTAVDEEGVRNSSYDTTERIKMMVMRWLKELNTYVWQTLCLVYSMCLLI